MIISKMVARKEYSFECAITQKADDECVSKVDDHAAKLSKLMSKSSGAECCRVIFELINQL
jgi:hypothetical protein